MKIESNETFECYETAYESWHGGKDITLDGIKLIPITILDKIKAEVEQIELLAVYTRGDIKSMALEIIDKYRAESEVGNEAKI
ncbi:hypothetical protein SAMN05660484_02171 [Eubacterium ruminantium]|uniref:Uncharacterized protein n=1 Tax=Eubacterium ruminantium TaxID=42322 RepID=A0A1T4QQV0_9FIRM|nr:hypothetical protein [Eubacterium ruminantium]SCW63415.1 hypothetical protein SAMN05660484_02171 [Eubacterium ruminantium]SDN45170.1 hypothetical protein SAMN04490370_12527 [Eubacterium ruminantium]SKA06064.1 hypothetical protein SAMN02745110_02478 [Eubacterium ruminantium]